MDFGGLRILSLESRRAEMMEQLIRRYGGEPFVAPSVQDAPFNQNEEIWRWADRLFRGEFDMLVLMTGVGLTYLRDAVIQRYSQSAFADALRRLTNVSRGPKPVVVLHEMGVRSEIVIPEPDTWKEIVPFIAERPERRITVQEYGRPNPQFLAALEGLGASVTSVAIYRWTLPDDRRPLREAVRGSRSGSATSWCSRRPSNSCICSRLPGRMPAARPKCCRRFARIWPSPPSGPS